MSNLDSQLPFESRYKTYRILNYGKPYKNYRTYDVRHNPNNTGNISFIYVDNEACSSSESATYGDTYQETYDEKPNSISETTALLQSKLNMISKSKNNIKKKIIKTPIYYVEIHYLLEANKEPKPKLEYIMNMKQIIDLLSIYGYTM